VNGRNIPSNSHSFNSIHFWYKKAIAIAHNKNDHVNHNLTIQHWCNSSVNTQTEQRECIFTACTNANYTPVQASIIANRVTNKPQAIAITHSNLEAIQPYTYLKGAMESGEAIAKAVKSKKRIGVLTRNCIGGSSSNAMMQHALCGILHYPADLLFILIDSEMQADAGISQAVIDQILALPKEERPEVIITAGCGCRDESNMMQLAENGITIIITDHKPVAYSGILHSAISIVNPWQYGCQYADKSISGATVAWLVMWAAYDYAYSRSWTNKHNLTALWDYVALGTIADEVSLASTTNRLIVKHGLRLIASGVKPCWLALKAAQPKPWLDIDESTLSQLNAGVGARAPYLAVDFLMSPNLPRATSYWTEITRSNGMRQAFKQTAPIINSDGDITKLGKLSLDLYREISQLKPFGSGFAAPVFTAGFKILHVATIGHRRKTHLRILVRDDNGAQYQAIWYNALQDENSVHPVKPGQYCQLHFELLEDDSQGGVSLRLGVIGLAQRKHL